MLSWEEHVKKGNVKKTPVNEGVIKTLVELAENNLKFISEIKLTPESSSLVFKDYYDSLRSVCEAVALSKGYKIYSHEALGLFLKNILKENVLFYKFDKFRLMRNGLQYYGKRIDFNEAKQGIVEVNKMIRTLKKDYLK